MRIKLKYFLPGIFCLANTIAIYSQQKADTLITNESGASKTHVARDQIVMRPGFQFNSFDGHNFNAKIDQTLIFPPTDNTYATASGVITQDPALGGVVGSIPGQFNVSGTGGATYSFPIECPPGINGMQPSISLVYNSQGGDGPLGIGWAISGLSAISCTSKTLYSNGEIDAIDLSKCATQYSLDGNNLFSNSSVYGGNGATYYTENQTQAQIFSYGSLYSGTTRAVPEYFIVTTKEGNVIEYRYLVRAGSSTTTAPYQWLISKITDPNGNYITFSYATYGNKQAVIRTIQYTGNASGALPFEAIQFDYGTKTKNSVHYIAGLPVDDALFLNSIKVAYSPNAQTFTINNQYALSYITNNDKYYLNSLTEYDKLGNKKNPTIFSWGTDPISQNVQTCSVADVNMPTKTLITRRFASGDINGDGFSDIIQQFRVKSNLTNEISDYISVNSGGVGNNSEVLIDKKFIDTESALGSMSYSVSDAMIVGEFNGDRKKTILVPILQSAGGDNMFKLKDVNTSVCFNYQLQVSSCIPAYANADFNNDGIDEILIIEKSRLNGNLVGGIFYVKKNDYTSELSSADQSEWKAISLSIGSDVKDVFVSDFNNDGLKDIMLVTSAGTIILLNKGGITPTSGCTKVDFVVGTSNTLFNSNYSFYKPGDFNGDGLLDFLVNEHCNSVWKLILNTGSGFTYTLVSSMLAKEEDYTTKNDDKDECIIVDLNHDGKSDVVLVDAVYSYQHNIWGDKWGDYEHTDVKWYTSTGTSFNEVKSDTITDENYCFRRNQAVGDFNADGYEELFTFDSNLLTGTDASDAGRTYYLNTNFNANKIIGITDGLNNTTLVDYQLLPYTTDRFGTRNFYSIGTNSAYPITDLQIPIPCVNRVIVPDGIGGISTTEYSYAGLKAHTLKGLLGFSSLTISNALNDIKTVSTTNYSAPLYLPSAQVNEIFSISQNFKISRSESIYSNNKTGKLIKTKLTQTLDNNYLSNSTKKTEYLSYDDWGNPTHILSTTGDDDNQKFVDKFTIFGPHGSIFPNKVDSMTTISSLANENLEVETFTKISAFKYDTKGNLTKKISDSNDINQLTTEYLNFNVYGNPTEIKNTANGNSRSSSVAYTSGRFISSKTDMLGQTITYDWDAITNLLKSETNRLGKTEYTYDSQGQLVETKYPDGKRTAKVLQWAGSGNSYGAKYFTYNETSGSAPAYVWYDALGRELASDTYGLNNQKISVFQEYLANGNLFRVSEPKFKAATKTWSSTYGYDSYGRRNVVITLNGVTSTTYDGRVTTVTSPTGTIVQNLKSNGLLEYTIQNGKRVDFTYYPSGLTKTSTPEGGQPLLMEYDLQGNQVKLVDPDAGTIESKYNGFGELLWSKQSIHNGTLITTTNTYAPTTGLLQNIVRNGETTSYHYDSKNRMDSVGITGKHAQSFVYDSFDRVTNHTEYINGKSFSSETGYDALGREKRHKYPSSYSTFNIYDNNGNLIEVRDDDNHSIWKPLEEDARGQLTRVSRGGKETSFGFDSRGLPTSITSAGVVDMTYSFNTKGNLEYRQDNLASHNLQKEQFIYDGMNRLTNWDIYQNNSTTAAKLNSQVYDTNGNISTRSGLDNLTMNYGENGKPHALTSISGKPQSMSSDSLGVTYTDFKKIATLTEGNKSYALTYGVDDERRMSVYKVNGSTRLTRYYLGDYEEEVDASGNVRKIHYLSGGAVLIRNKGKDSLLYGYSDYQGSLIALTDENGTVVEQYAYDPWGNRRNPADWTASDTRTSWRLNRGYTGHEHLDAFAIINMNGRVYDPLTGMFFSPDPQLQDPGNWMNYNRYGYCYNNPLIYSDPSGEFLTWNISKHGFSIGINGTPAGLPYGAGINVGWDDGFSLGGYVEVGPRVGGTGFGSGATISQSVDYNFKHNSWSTTTSAGGYASFGTVNAGANMYLTYDFTNNKTYDGWGASAGFGVGNIGVYAGYSPNGFSYGIGGTIGQSALDYDDDSNEPFVEANLGDYPSDTWDYYNKELTKKMMIVNGYKDGNESFATATTPVGLRYANNEKYWNPKTQRYIIARTFKNENGISEMHISPFAIDAGYIYFKAITRHEILHSIQLSRGLTNQTLMEKAAYQLTYNIFKVEGQNYYATLTKHLAQSLGFWGFSPINYR